MPTLTATPTSVTTFDPGAGAAARASAPVASAAPAASDAAPRLDGRRIHIVDRALDYVALAATGLSAVRIARKRRRSAGYVSILLRLGQAIRTMEPAELAALRSPRVTWKLAQRIVRADADVGSIRHQLRLAVGGFSTHNVDRRKHRVRRAGGGEGAARAGTAWGWDESWFTKDPLDYVRHHLAHLAAVHRTVGARAQRHASLRSARRLSVGQSLSALQRSLAARQAAPESSSDPESRALAALAILERHLAAARAELAPLLDLPGKEEAPPPPKPARRSTPRATSGALASAHEIDEDLG